MPSSVGNAPSSRCNGAKPKKGRIKTDRPQREGTFAQKLNHLFRTSHRPGGGELSNEDVASAIRDRGGPTVSATYLWQLRKGIRDNPTKKHLEALADFFRVPPAYFFDDALAARYEAELELVAALRDKNIHHIALRAFGLSPTSFDKIVELVEWIRELERIPKDQQYVPGDSAETDHVGGDSRAIGN